MERKEALLAAVDTAIRQVGQVEDSLGDDERKSSGTFERWAPKDGINHVAAWLDRDLKDIASGSDTIDAVAPDALEDVNKAMFDQYAGKTWEESMDFFRRTYDECRLLVDGLDEADLDRKIKRSDGSSRAVWRMIAGHALMHASGHFSLIYDRAGQPEKGTAFEEQVFRTITEIDDSPEWTATAKYNLACRYSLAGDTGRALSLLGEVFIVSHELKEWAGKDEDLDSLRDEPEFRKLMD